MLGESGHKDAWKAWKSGKRPLYPATLSVTVEPVSPPHGSEPALRSMLATQVIFSCFYPTLHWLISNCTLLSSQRAASRRCRMFLERNWEPMTSSSGRGSLDRAARYEMQNQNEYRTECKIKTKLSWSKGLFRLNRFLMINQHQPIFPDPNSRLPRTGQWTSRMFCCRFFCLWQVATNVFYETSFIWENRSSVDNITIIAYH